MAEPDFRCSANGFFTLSDWRQLNSEGKWSAHCTRNVV